jgi:hypothetical protein
VIPHVASGALVLGDHVLVVDAEDYLDVRRPEWIYFEQIGAVWSAGRQVFIALSVDDVVRALAEHSATVRADVVVLTAMIRAEELTGALAPGRERAPIKSVRGSM